MFRYRTDCILCVAPQRQHTAGPHRFVLLVKLLVLEHVAQHRGCGFGSFQPPGAEEEGRKKEENTRDTRLD